MLAAASCGSCSLCLLIVPFLSCFTEFHVTLLIVAPTRTESPAYIVSKWPH